MVFHPNNGRRRGEGNLIALPSSLLLLLLLLLLLALFLLVMLAIALVQLFNHSTYNTMKCT